MAYYENGLRYNGRNYPVGNPNFGRAPSFGGSFLSRIPIMPIILIVAIIILFKPVKDFVSNLFGGVTVLFKSFGNWTGYNQTIADKTIEAAKADPTSYWKPAFSLNAPAGAKLLTTADAKKKLEIIYSAFGYFYDDFDKILGVFNTLKTQSQVSSLAYHYAQTHNQKDFLGYLQGESFWPNDRLDNDQIAQLDSLIKKLPKYK